VVAPAASVPAAKTVPNAPASTAKPAAVTTPSGAAKTAAVAVKPGATPAPAPAKAAGAPAAFQEDEPAGSTMLTTITAGGLACLTWATAGILAASYFGFL
jgi:hypothetical protein